MLLSVDPILHLLILYLLLLGQSRFLEVLIVKPEMDTELLSGLGSTLHGELAGFFVDSGDRLDLWAIKRATQGALYARQ
jgi:hypothetical protein